MSLASAEDAVKKPDPEIMDAKQMTDRSKISIMELRDDLDSGCGEPVPPGSVVASFHNTADWMKIKIGVRPAMTAA